MTGDPLVRWRSWNRWPVTRQQPLWTMAVTPALQLRNTRGLAGRPLLSACSPWAFLPRKSRVACPHHTPLAPVSSCTSPRSVGRTPEDRAFPRAKCRKQSRGGTEPRQLAQRVAWKDAPTTLSGTLMAARGGDRSLGLRFQILLSESPPQRKLLSGIPCLSQRL